MPLFNRKVPDQAPPAPQTTTNGNRRSGIFGSKREAAPATTNNHHHNNNNVATNNGTNNHQGSGLLHRNKEDPSITGARQRVLAAEQAERDADRALIQARAAVKAAREEVLRLEKEAAEE